MLLDEAIGKKLPPGVKVPYWTTDLIQWILELENAPMDSLSPQLQELKLGFEQMPLDPTKSKGIERRVNEALIAAGEEPGIKLIFSDRKLDRSTIPPTRVIKTAKDRNEGFAEREKRLKDLRKHNRKLYATVMAIMAEDVASMPIQGLPVPQVLPDGSMSIEVSRQVL